MLSLLDLLGTIGASVLGLPGIVGVGVGMATRKWWLAAIIGGIVGLLAPMVLGGSHSTEVAITQIEYTVSILIGIIAGVVGCAIRHKGAAV